MDNKDLGAEFIMRKNTHKKNLAPPPLSSALCPHSSIQIFSFFMAVCLGEKMSLVKECGQDYISCSQLCSSLLIGVAGRYWPKPNLSPLQIKESSASRVFVGPPLSQSGLPSMEGMTRSL